MKKEIAIVTAVGLCLILTAFLLKRNQDSLNSGNATTTQEVTREDDFQNDANNTVSPEVSSYGSIGNSDITILNPGLNPETNSETNNSSESDANVATTSNKTNNSNPQNIELHAFGNNLAKMLKASQTSAASDASTFDTLVKNPTAQTFDAVAALAQKYGSTGASIKALTIPQVASMVTTDVATGYVSVGEQMQKLASYKSQGKVPADAFSSYNDESIKLDNALVSLVLFFKNNSVTFGANEDGYIFMQSE